MGRKILRKKLSSSRKRRLPCRKPARICPKSSNFLNRFKNLIYLCWQNFSKIICPLQYNAPRCKKLWSLRKTTQSTALPARTADGPRCDSAPRPPRWSTPHGHPEKPPTPRSWNNSGWRHRQSNVSTPLFNHWNLLGGLLKMYNVEGKKIEIKNNDKKYQTSA